VATSSALIHNKQNWRSPTVATQAAHLWVTSRAGSPDFEVGCECARREGGRGNGSLPA